MSLPRPPITPIEEPAPSTPPSQALVNPAPYLNTLIVIGLITASGILILYIARKKRNIFRVLISILIWLISFGVTNIYILNLALIMDFQLLRFWLPLSVLAASLVTYSLLMRGELASSIAASYIASGAGGTIGMSIPYWTFMILIVGISAYDIFAVYRGHLSTLTKEDASLLKGLTIEVGDVVVGMGDLFFYSLTLAAIFWNLGYIPAIAGTTWILIGYAITLYCLQRRRILPGLPIPLLGALALAFLAKTLSALTLLP
ncbi:MAG: hypothetical protein N3F65_00145 [Nitrososphaeria archaeon]|nr:hypothetical protein [Aigarchaeota archaeon]MCX8187011.1 hypothetical protein [Nitrososphaeria archaeon]MDW8021333.1 hypothetical protein [Nitrososphaerota archaeon]